MDSFTILGISFSTAQVATFVLVYVYPTLAGWLMSFLMHIGKSQWVIAADPKVRTYIIRSLIAVLCVMLNAAEIWLAHGTLSWAVIGQSILAYFAASASYVHFFQS